MNECFVIALLYVRKIGKMDPPFFRILEPPVRIYNIGALNKHVSKKEVEEWVNAGPQPKPLYIPPDVTGQASPFS